MSNDRSALVLALNEDNELFTAGYHNGMRHGIMIPGDFMNDPLAWTDADGKHVKACGGFFTTSNSKGQDTPVERKYDDTAMCKNCAKLGKHEEMMEAARTAKWDNSYEKIEAMAELATAAGTAMEAQADAVEAVAITLPTMLTMETREESPAQADGPSVEVCKITMPVKPGATLPGETSNTPQDSKTPAPRKISKPKEHKPLSEPKLFGDVSGAVHTEDRQNPSADDLVGGAQAGTYRGHTSLTSGRDMTGAMPRERAEGDKPVRTTMDMPLGRERLDISAQTDKKIVQTEHGAKIVTDRVGGKFGFLNGADYHKLSRSAQRRYWSKVQKAKRAALAEREAQAKGDTK